MKNGIFTEGIKIGLLAYSTNTGLGYQTLEFAENMNPDKILVADLSIHNNVETHHERYYQPKIDLCNSPHYLSKESCEWLVDGMDVVFVCETPLNYYIYEYAKQKGVKVIQQYNYEFLDYFRRPGLPSPALLAAPTLWNIDKVCDLNVAPVQYLPVPVDTKKIRYRNISKVETLIHIIGRPAAHDRNGTLVFLDMIKSLGKSFKYKIYLQPPVESRAISHFEPVKRAIQEAKAQLGYYLEIIENTPDNSKMYEDGDLLVLPRRYGGLCLPMWEALSAGIPVVMPNISPNNKILPEGWLVESKLSGNFQAHTNILLYEAFVKEMIVTIYKMAENIRTNNLLARDIAERNSWDVWKPIFIKDFEKLCA